MSKLTDDLRKMGIINTLMIIEGNVPLKVAIFYNTEHPHAFGYKDYRVSIHFINDEGRHRSKTLTRSHFPHIRLGTAKENRDQFFAAAIEYFNEKMWRGEGTVEWVRDPFTELGWQWIPKQTHDALMSSVKEWRKQQGQAAGA